MRLFAWVHPRVAPLVSVGAVVPLLRSAYLVDGAVLFDAPPVAFAATLGVEVALGRATDLHRILLCARCGVGF